MKSSCMACLLQPVLHWLTLWRHCGMSRTWNCGSSCATFSAGAGRAPVVVQREHRQLLQRRERAAGEGPRAQPVPAQPQALQRRQAAQRRRQRLQRVVPKVGHARRGDRQRGRRQLRQRRLLAAQRDDARLCPRGAARLLGGTT